MRSGRDVCRHPANDRGSQPNSPYGRDVGEPKGHFARNRDIVASAQAGIGTPWHNEQPPPKSGGGTWMTVDHFRRMAVPVGVIWPDGREEWKPLAKPETDGCV